MKHKNTHTTLTLQVLQNPITLTLFLLGSTLFLQACGTTAPFKEREEALSIIALAEAAEANRLAPSEFSSANTALIEGNNNIVCADKDSEKTNPTAQEAYINAFQNGRVSLEKSLQALINETDASYTEKNNAISDPAQQDKLTEVKSHIDQAQAYLNNATSQKEDTPLFTEASTSCNEPRILDSGNPHQASYTEITQARNLLSRIYVPISESSYTVILNEADRDTLQKISKRLFGDIDRWQEIYDLNDGLINDPDLIFPGQVLKLPTE